MLSGELTKKPSSAKRNKEELKESESPKKHKNLTEDTPQKNTFTFEGETGISPSGTRYNVNPSEEVRSGRFGTVCRLDDGKGKSVALKLQRRHGNSPHSEAEDITRKTRHIHGYGSLFCPAINRAKCKDIKPVHATISQYFSGKNPYNALEDYFHAIKDKSNAASLAIFGLLTVFITLVEANVMLHTKKGVIHGDAHDGNFILQLNQETQQLIAQAVDLDHSLLIDETAPEEIVDAISRDISSIGYFFKKALDLFKDFACVLQELRSITNQMQDRKGKKYADFESILKILNELYKRIQDSFVKEKEDDFTHKQILGAPAKIKPEHAKEEAAPTQSQSAAGIDHSDALGKSDVRESGAPSPR